MTGGMESRPLTSDEMATMERLLGEGLAAGAWGLSSGLFTAPGCYADPAEILALARVLRHHGAAYSTHVRDEADRVGEAGFPRGTSCASPSRHTYRTKPVAPSARSRGAVA